MTWIVQNLWLIPGLPLLAAGLSALLKQRERTAVATLVLVDARQSNRQYLRRQFP